MAEKAANNVGAYGGLGAHGLDFGEDGNAGSALRGDKALKDIEGSFSSSALIFAPKIKPEFSDDEENLCEEVAQIEEV